MASEEPDIGNGRMGVVAIVVLAYAAFSVLRLVGGDGLDAVWWISAVFIAALSGNMLYRWLRERR